MQELIAQLANTLTPAITGRVVRTEGVTAAAADFPAPVGALVEIERQGAAPVAGEVIGFRDRLTLIFPLAEMTGVRRGSRVRLVQTCRSLRVGEHLLGRIVDAHLQPRDGRPLAPGGCRVRLTRRAPEAATRPQIAEPLSTGVRAIDSMLTCGRGQRMGIFAGSGVGKSTTLGMMARYTSAEVNVIALIGERGREVNEFVHDCLGEEGLRRSVVVVATSDEPALARVDAALAATAIAEHFRDQGKDVMLLLDSLTRFAMAQREIGLAAGEPPTTRGYPPSVFALLPRLVERAGLTQCGSITGFYSVLVEGDDTNEPISDTVRGLLDGHTVLARSLAVRGHFPAIDVLESISRLAARINNREQQEAAQLLRELLAVRRQQDDLVAVGAYRPGTNPALDTAIELEDEFNRLLRQGAEERCDLKQAQQQLLDLAALCRTRLRGSAAEPTKKAS